MGQRALTWLIRHRAPALVLIDLVAFQVALFFTWSLRFESGMYENPLDLDLAGLSLVAAVLSTFWFGVYLFRGVYRRKISISRYEAVVDVLKAVFVGILLLFVMTWSPDPFSHTRTVLVTYGLLLVFFSGAGHALFRTFIRLLYSRRIGLFRSVIVGGGRRGQTLFDTLSTLPEFGHQIQALFANPDTEEGEPDKGVPAHTVDRLKDYLDSHPEIEYVLIALEPEDRDRVMEVIEIAHFSGTRVMIMPDFFQILVGMAKSRELYGVPMLEVFPDPMGPAQKIVKRLVDLIVAVLVLTVGLPILAIVAVLVKASSPGPALYVQKRVGWRGKEFPLYKFRSMYQDAEKHTGAVWASERDPRITPVGLFLRKSRLDELPQAWNVLRGDMSLVGPRPERRVFVDEFIKVIPFYNRRHNVKPGITGWAQVRRGYDTSIDDVREKLQYDLFYLENMSIGLDIKILLNTTWVVIMGKGQ